MAIIDDHVRRMLDDAVLGNTTVRGCELDRGALPDSELELHPLDPTVEAPVDANAVTALTKQDRHILHTNIDHRSDLSDGRRRALVGGGFLSVIRPIAGKQQRCLEAENRRTVDD